MGLKEVRNNIKKDWLVYAICLTCLLISMVCLNQMKEADKICDERYADYIESLKQHQPVPYMPIELDLSDMNQSIISDNEWTL